MQTRACLGARDLVSVMVAYRDALAEHREVINRLNVYPVPDGDTGTNMALTMESVVADLAAHDDEDLAGVARALAHGSLMGARGNSGVILSQILRGVAKVVGASDGIDGAVLATALGEATTGAYQAVQQPVEGTILSVVRAAAESLAGPSPGRGAGGDLLEAAATAREAAAAALAATTDQLPALQEAGVVDSGGTGLLLLFDALLHVIDGRPVPAAPDGTAADLPSGAAWSPSVPSVAEDPPSRPGPAEPGPTPVVPAPSLPPRGSEGRAHPSGPRFEVMYLLEAPDDTVAGFRSAWGTIGDSIVVVGGDGLHNCHIHTDDVGAAIEAAIDVGRPRQIRVTDLWDEVEEERWVRQAVAPAEGDTPAAPDRATAVVAVCAGDGVRRIFESLGVAATVSGGQSMNPSTADLLAAIDAVGAEQVVVLPNNKNIVAVARAAALQATKIVRVVATRGIPEGFAALLSYDPGGDAEVNSAAMQAAAESVAAGEVTRAVRTAASPAGDVHEGDWLGISRSGIEVVAPDAYGAASGLLARLVDAAHHEVVTIIVGEGAEPADTRRITDWLDEHRPGVTGEVHHGGQPLYPYLFGVE